MSENISEYSFLFSVKDKTYDVIVYTCIQDIHYEQCHILRIVDNFVTLSL
jgi:hypothetical protein